jgi:NitT/TauT family transport system substrate-binding protein
MRRLWLSLLLLALLASGCSPPRATAGPVLRLGYFPNLTHGPAVLGMADGSFATAVGMPVEGRLFPSGPAGLTALLAGEVDMLYVGPVPAVTAYIRSGGEGVRIIAGVASGGAGLVLKDGVKATGSDRSPALSGLRLASPGVANTQDVALRHYLSEHELSSHEAGGNVRLMTTSPTEILTLFKLDRLDGAWVAEPWTTRLIRAGGRLAVDERSLWPNGQVATAVLTVRPAFLQAHPEAVQGILAAHRQKVAWLAGRPQEAAPALQAALAKLQGKAIPLDQVEEALTRIDFTADPLAPTIFAQAERAAAAGYLPRPLPDLRHLIDPLAR